MGAEEVIHEVIVFGPDELVNKVVETLKAHQGGEPVDFREIFIGDLSNPDERMFAKDISVRKMSPEGIRANKEIPEEFYEGLSALSLSFESEHGNIIETLVQPCDHNSLKFYAVAANVSGSVSAVAAFNGVPGSFRTDSLDESQIFTVGDDGLETFNFVEYESAMAKLTTKVILEAMA